MLDNILVLSYPQGAAGKLLGTVLMSSESVAHWDDQVEIDKDNEKCFDYVQKSFTPDLTNWIKTEPNHTKAWNLHFISAKYSRGETLSPKQFADLANEHATENFHRAVQSNKMCMFPWHKTHDNVFASCKKITVLIDEPAVQWFDQALWRKHYRVENNRVKFLVHDVAQNPYQKRYHKQHNNPMYSEHSVEDTYINEIVNNPDKKNWRSPIQFRHRKRNICVDLSDLLDLSKFMMTVERVVHYHKLEPVNHSFAKVAHQHWSSCHGF